MDEEKFFKIIQSDKKTINKILSEIDKFYLKRTEVKINKLTGEPKKDKNGNPILRFIYPSISTLNEIQKRIHKKILGLIKYPDYVQGGIKGKSNATNAKMHKGKKYKFETDIRNFFPWISNEMVFKTLLKQGFRPQVASHITKLTTFKGQVPQGTTTASSIANLFFYHSADQKINNLCKENKITYSRYIDDIFCSSQVDFKPLIPEIISFITDAGMNIHPKKTSYGVGVKEITGIKTMNNSLRVSDQWNTKISDPTRSKQSIEGLYNYKNYVKKISNQKNN